MKSNLPTVFGGRGHLSRRNEDAKTGLATHRKVGVRLGVAKRSPIDLVADGLKLDENRTCYSDEEVRRVTYNQDLVAAIRDFEAQANVKYFRERARLWKSEVSSVEFCRFATCFKYKTARNYRDLIPFLSLQSIEKHYDFLVAKGLERPVRTRVRRLTGGRVPVKTLGPRLALSQIR